MQLDSSDSLAIAGGDMIGENNSSVNVPEGGIISGQASDLKPEVLLYTGCSDWCYLFIHHMKVRIVQDRFERDGMFRTFVHKTVIYSRIKDKKISTEKPTISGLIFIQGEVNAIRRYLFTSFPWLHLVKDCSTGEIAVIPNIVMEPFMRVLEIDPTRIRFMLKPISEYASGNPLLRITSGIFLGMEGYVVRIDRDRRLVMAIGNMTVAISGIHKEDFERVEDYDAVLSIAGNQ